MKTIRLTKRVEAFAVFAALAQNYYQGNFILQTARAAGGNHSEVLSSYRDMTIQWMQQYGLVEDK